MNDLLEIPRYFFSRYAEVVTLGASVLRSGQLNTKISDLAPRNLH